MIRQALDQIKYFNRRFVKMSKKRGLIFTAEKPDIELSRKMSAITSAFAKQNDYEIVDIIDDYNEYGCISQESKQEIFDAINEDDVDAVFILTAEMISSHYADIIQFIAELKAFGCDLYSVADDIYYKAMGEGPEVFITDKKPQCIRPFYLRRTKVL